MGAKNLAILDDLKLDVFSSIRDAISCSWINKDKSGTMNPMEKALVYQINFCVFSDVFHCVDHIRN